MRWKLPQSANLGLQPKISSYHKHTLLMKEVKTVIGIQKTGKTVTDLITKNLFNYFSYYIDP